MCGLGRRNQKPFQVSAAEGAKVPRKNLPERVMMVSTNADAPDQPPIKIGSPVQTLYDELDLEPEDEILVLHCVLSYHRIVLPDYRFLDLYEYGCSRI